MRKRKGSFSFEHSAGGLASGLEAFHKGKNSVWVGWPGLYLHKEEKKKEKEIKEKLVRKFNYHPVFQSQTDIERYYSGYCNSTIWPLFHYFTKVAVYDKTFWQAYKRVNELFCDAILRIAKPGDTIWVHDYHLILLPALLRQKLPEAKIGFFLHIPFPSFELFRLLPQREEILRGFLGADLIGFHIYEYARHFLNSVHRLLGYDHSLGQINTGDRVVKADAFPLGIDFEKFNKAASGKKVQKEIEKLRKKIGSRKVVLSIDRLDYTKGVPQRLEAFSSFLERYHEWREKVIFILVAVPSRTKVEEYHQMKKQVDELIGRINGRYGNLGWSPIWYLYRSFEFTELAALYTISDLALITPVRDGMNLIAKEFIATKRDGKGVLVLSEMAGAAKELSESLIVNPNNKDEIVDALKRGLQMPTGEQLKRNKWMQKELEMYNEKWWSKNFMEALSEIKLFQEKMREKLLNSEFRKKLIKDYRNSEKRLLLLDYDGTLVPFAGTPEEAKPDKELLDLLDDLSKDPKNEVVIISGRDNETLDKWFGDLNVGLAAEHGVRIKENGEDWLMMEKLTSDWMKEVRPILDRYVGSTPGSFVEEKAFSLVWHYRKSDPTLGLVRLRELVAILEDIASSFNLQILEGSKVIEVKNSGVNKGKAVSHWTTKGKRDFILALGDDTTDEDMFSALPKDAYSLKVGLGKSQARFNLKSIKEVRPLLKELL